MGAPKLKPHSDPSHDENSTEQTDRIHPADGSEESGDPKEHKLQQASNRVRELEGEVQKTLDVMDRKVYQLECITEFSRLMNSTLNPSQVKEQALRATCNLTEAETATLYLVDEKTNELFFETTLGDAGEQIQKELRLPIDETSIAGSVAMTGRSIQVNDVSRDPRHFKKADKKSSFTTRNMIVCPVINKARVIGVLQAINKLRGGFITEDLQLLETLAHQVAIAIENANLYLRMKRNFHQTATALAEAIEVRDLYTAGHSKRVMKFSLAIGRQMGLDDETLESIELAAVLHDIGKIGIDDCVLRKQGKLNDEEFEAMKKHPEYGYEILSHIEELQNVTLGIRHHHEKFDGSGYPMGLRKEEIPIVSRVIAVADTFDAMTSTRPYRKALDGTVAVQELKDWSGQQFDPQVVEAFLVCYDRGEIVPHILFEQEEEKQEQLRKKQENMSQSTKPKKSPEEFER